MVPSQHNVLLCMKHDDFLGGTILPCVGLWENAASLATPPHTPPHALPTKCQSCSQPLDKPNTHTHFQPPSGWELLMSFQ